MKRGVSMGGYSALIDAARKYRKYQFTVAKIATMDRLDAMQIFVRIAEAGSFVAVANQLDLDRSVVTRQISALEKSLGTKLINRTTRRIGLTTAGAAYLERCRVILQMVETAETGLRDDKAELRGRIRVSLPLSFGLGRVLPALLDFAERHPNLELGLEFSDRRSNLIEEGIDLAVRITARLDPGDVARKLGACELLTLASPDYLRRHGTPRKPADLRDHACLGYAADLPARAWVYSQRGGDIQVPVQGRIAANNGDALMQAAVRGLGVTRQPDFIAEPFLRRRQVVRVLDDFRPEPLGIYAILPSNRFVPHRVAALLDVLARTIGKVRA